MQEAFVKNFKKTFGGRWFVVTVVAFLSLALFLYFLDLIDIFSILEAKMDIAVPYSIYWGFPVFFANVSFFMALVFLLFSVITGLISLITKEKENKYKLVIRFFRIALIFFFFSVLMNSVDNLVGEYYFSPLPSLSLVMNLKFN